MGRPLSEHWWALIWLGSRLIDGAICWRVSADSLYASKFGVYIGFCDRFIGINPVTELCHAWNIYPRQSSTSDQFFFLYRTPTSLPVIFSPILFLSVTRRLKAIRRASNIRLFIYACSTHTPPPLSSIMNGQQSGHSTVTINMVYFVCSISSKSKQQLKQHSRMSISFVKFEYLISEFVDILYSLLILEYIDNLTFVM